MFELKLQTLSGYAKCWSFNMNQENFNLNIGTKSSGDG
jgi:hypothetical protein